MTYWIAVDIFLIAVVSFCVIGCARRGFVSSLIRLLGLVLALVGSAVLSRLLAPVIFEHWFRDGISDSVSAKLAEFASTDVYALIELILSGPEGIIASIFGGERRAAELIEGGLNTLDIESAAGRIVDSVVRPAYEALIQVVLFVLCFVVIICIVSAVVHITRAVNAVPVIGTVNRVLGAFFGVIYGVCVCLLIVAAAAFVFNIIGRSEDYNRLVADNTVLFSLLYRNNPLLHT